MLGTHSVEQKKWRLPRLLSSDGFCFIIAVMIIIALIDGIYHL